MTYNVFGGTLSLTQSTIVEMKGDDDDDDDDDDGGGGDDGGDRPMRELICVHKLIEASLVYYTKST